MQLLGKFLKLKFANNPNAYESLNLQQSLKQNRYSGLLFANHKGFGNEVLKNSQNFLLTIYG